MPSAIFKPESGGKRHKKVRQQHQQYNTQQSTSAPDITSNKKPGKQKTAKECSDSLCNATGAT
eukprot:10350723-Ditylum_brightwellii.AAC.1